MHLGSYAIDDLLTFTCNTHTPSTGAAVDADAVPGYRVYEDETGTPLLTGSMALLDDANTVGFYSEQITLSAANGFEAGKCYTVRITGVVGGVTGVTERSFQIGSKVNASASAVASVTGAVGSVTGAVGSVTGAVGSVTAGVSLADDAITSAKFDESTAFPITSADTGATAVARTGADSDTLETLSDQLDGVEPADVWSYATRTLTQSAAAVAAVVAGSTLTIQRGDDLSAALTDLGSIAGRKKLWFTLKSDSAAADTASVLQIEETAGLVYLNGAAGTGAQGDITVDDEDDGDITITLKAASAAQLLAGTYVYDVQWVDASDAVHTLASGTARIVADITRATS